MARGSITKETLYQQAMQQRAVAESHEAAAHTARDQERSLIAQADKLLRDEQQTEDAKCHKMVIHRRIGNNEYCQRPRGHDGECSQYGL